MGWIELLRALFGTPDVTAGKAHVDRFYETTRPDWARTVKAPASPSLKGIENGWEKGAAPEGAAGARGTMCSGLVKPQGLIREK